MRASPALLTGLLGVLSFASPAAAQEVPSLQAGGMDAHNFFPAPYDGDARDPLRVHRVGGWSGVQGFAGAVLEYAEKPMSYCIDDECSEGLDVLDNVYAMNISGGYAPIDRLRIFVGAPIYFDTQSDVTPGGGGFGDIRLGAQVAAFTDDGPFQAGVVPWLDIPTGDADRFLGNSGIAGGAAVAGSAEAGPVTFSGDVGMQFDPASVSNTDGANSVLVGLAVGVTPAEGFGITAETRLEPSFIEDPVPGTGSPSEMMYHARYKTESGFHFMAGAAHAITSGPGTALFRTFLGFGWESEKDRPPKDTDMDGIPDKVDECVEEPETMNGWRDMDGCPDDIGKLKVRVMLGDNPVEGAAVRVVGPKGGSNHTSPEIPRFEGLPGEQWKATANYGHCFAGEGEATLDPGKNSIRIDLVRIERNLKVIVKTEAGEPVTDALVKWLEPEENFGCHATGEHAVDGNGEYSTMLGRGKHQLVVQAEERSPQRFEFELTQTADKVIEVTMKAAKTKLSAERIDILEKVFFETGSDVIKEESFESLTEVATVLIANPHIKKVEVAGHTDNKGADDFNLELSQKRAESVRRWLIEHEVASDRLEAKGYGETVPIANNRTEKGRAQNRRVEFVIVDPAPESSGAEQEKDQ